MSRLFFGLFLIITPSISALAADMFTVEYDCKHTISKEKNGIACSIEKKWSGGYWLIVRIYSHSTDSKDQKDRRHYVESILYQNFGVMGGYGIQQRIISLKTGKRMEQNCFPDKYHREEQYCNNWEPAIHNWE